jgi:type VI secretion system secreted protein VgrG
VLDDTPDRIQAQLRSDHQCSVLSLGRFARIEDHAGRKEERGEGFELRTDGHGVLRAARGMLITTEARPNAANHALDMGETTARLANARALHRGLAEAALAAKAQDAGDDQSRVAQVLAAQNDAIRGGPGDPAAGRCPELQAAQLLLASAAGIAATTPGSLHLQAGGPLALTSEGPASFSALRRLLVAAREGVRLFALRHGMRWIAASGAVRVEARAGAIGLEARGAVRITSSTADIRIAAPKRIVVNGGGSFSEWSSEGIVHGTPGRWVEHAASHVKTGPVGPPF